VAVEEGLQGVLDPVHAIVDVTLRAAACLQHKIAEEESKRKKARREYTTSARRNRNQKKPKETMKASSEIKEKEAMC
jgi:spore cortex formation protein SpoVR/YcgB (stage V sporulation)